MNDSRHPGLSPALVADMEAKGIDIGLSLELLEGINAGRLGMDPPVRASGVPALDGRSVLDLSATESWLVGRNEARDRLAALGLALPGGREAADGMIAFDRATLAELGQRLFERTAWGVLNGGSATSYADRKKNGSIGPGVFDAIREGFELLAPLCENRPKGITPAYLNPDGSPGESFLVLKMRASLVQAARWRERFGTPDRPVLPFFQMTSAGTDGPLAEAYMRYAEHPWLAGLIERSGTDPTRPRSAVQPLMAAYTHSSEGMPKRVFDRAWGKADSSIALPGGHGQSFRVLRDIYAGLLSDGYRFAYLGNVDNTGYYPDPVELAVMALSGAETSCEFSFRTPVDVKGGILVHDQNGKKTIAELGQAMSLAEAERLQAEGKPILFNCATGIFDLALLVPRLDELSRRLPLRVSDQDKDAGRYSQAEQGTWEVLGLLDDPLFFAVSKSERFIAAKLLAETVLASGAVRPEALPRDVADTAASLSAGMNRFLAGPCRLVLRDGRWTL